MVKSSALRCCLKALPFLLILLYILAVVVPYIEHKEVSPEYRAAFEDRRFYGTGVGPERAAYIDNNKDALFCRINLIGNAEEEIILSTFDFNGDSSGTDMVSALFCAAERGVRVRVLVDGASGFLDVKKNPVFKALAGHKNVELKIYNPIDLLQPWKDVYKRQMIYSTFTIRTTIYNGSICIYNIFNICLLYTSLCGFCGLSCNRYIVIRHCKNMLSRIVSNSFVLHCHF